MWARTGQAVPYAMHSGDESVKAQGRYALSVDDGNADLAAGLAGLGILWLPDYMAKPHLASGELVPLFNEWRGNACRTTSNFTEPACEREVAGVH